MTEAAMPSWDDLFADLGLPTESAPAPRTPAAEAAPEPAAAEQEPMQTEEAPVPRGRRRRSPCAEVEEEPGAEAAEQHAELPVESVETSIAAEEPPLQEGEMESPPVEAGEEAPAPKGRSRRRRRGRGSKSAIVETPPVVPESDALTADVEAPVTEAAKSAPEEVETEEEAGRRQRRRRGRGRNQDRDEAPRVAVNANADEPDDPEEEGLEPVGREEEVDDLSNWNVPTWGELIGSLYRPER